MFEEELGRIRASVRRERMMLSNHAQDRMTLRHIGYYDIERAILKGRVIKQQQERSGELKYIIGGPAYATNYIEVAVKFTKAGKVKVITLY